MDSEAKRRPPLRAWVSAFGCSFSQFVCVFSLLAFGYNLTSIAADFGQSTAAFGLAPSLYGLCYAGLSVFWGMLADRIRVRKTVFVAMLGVGVFLAAAGLISWDVPSFIVLYTCAGVFSAGLGMSVLPKLIASWFPPEMRGKGILPATVGGSLAGVCSGLILPPVVEGLGWRGSFAAIGTVCLILAVLSFVFVRDGRFEEIRLAKRAADGAVTPATSVSVLSGREMLKAVLKMPTTWVIGVVLILYNVYYTSNTSFEVSALQSVGYDSSVVGLFESLNTGATMVGQLIFSSLADRLPRKNVLAFLLIVGGVMYVGLYGVAYIQSEVALLSYGAIAGLFVAVVPVYNNLAGEYYPEHLRGSGPGASATIALVGRFAGPLICSLIIVLSGGESMAFIPIAGGALVVGGIIAVFLPKPKYQ